MHTTNLDPMQLQALAKQFRKHADSLDAVAAFMTTGGTAAIMRAASEAEPKVQRRRVRRMSVKNSTRVGQIRKFLQEKGAARRRDIINDSGVPMGSVSTYLKEGQHFRKLADGRWALADSKEAA